MIALPYNLEGERRKLSAHAVMEARRESVLIHGRRALLRALLMTGTATADDVRLAVTLAEGIDPVCLGAVPGLLARAGVIRRAGFTNTRRAAGHARPVTVWELADRAAAERWLIDHPERTLPATAEAAGLFTAQNEKPGVSAPGLTEKD